MSLEQYLVPWGVNTNICFDCQRAVGYCPWSELDDSMERPRYGTVPGWDTKPSTVYKDTPHITKCPLFIRDEPREEFIEWEEM